MTNKPIDFTNLDFEYKKTNGNIRYYFSNQKWDSGTIHTDESFPIHIAATCLHYGQSCFEGLKVFQTKNGDIVAFRPDENYKRFVRSAQKLFMTPPTKEIFFDALNRVVNLNKEFIPPYGSNATLYVRPVLLGMSAHIGVKVSEDYLFMILVTPVGPYFKSGFQPVKMLVVEDLDRAAPFGLGDVKVGGNYAAGLRGSVRAKSEGFTDVIYLDTVHRKYIDESGPANFIAILNDGTFVTPKSNSILSSITNSSLQTIAREDFNWNIQQRPLSIDEITNFSEAGCCGTAAVITPVGTIRYKDKDYKLWDNGNSAGPKIKSLYERLTQIQWGEIEDKRNWLYKINLK